MIFRPALPGDYAAILGLWNPLIRETTVTFSSDEMTKVSLAQMIDARRAAGHDFFVVQSGDALLGFATYAQFRSGNGYAHAMEHTIILADGARGKGIGRALMSHLEAHARDAGGHTLFAAISAENHGGTGFHAAIGFRSVAQIPEAGRKFGRWIDLVLMMKFL